MNCTCDFWAFFEGSAAARLGIRADTFRRIFRHLDTLEWPLTLVETGCARSTDNWWGDGLSTLLFDRYLGCRDDGSTCVSVDIDPQSVENARGLVGPHVNVVQGDSVQFLSRLAERLVVQGTTVDLVYLDSFDLDKIHWQPSAIHHLKELTAIMPCLRSDTLVVVDDCPCTADFIPRADGEEHLFLNEPMIGGKGRLIAEYANAVGARLEFAQYQAGWTRLVGERAGRDAHAASPPEGAGAGRRCSTGRGVSPTRQSPSVLRAVRSRRGTLDGSNDEK